MPPDGIPIKLAAPFLEALGRPYADATDDKPFDTTIVYNLCQEHRQVAMRPLPLVDDALAAHYFEQTKPTLELFGIHHHGPMGENNMRTLRQYAKCPDGLYMDGVYTSI